ncbi:hypothetical protein LJR129_004912 [Acidovorax sp. LjRoot129]|uniref:hypothetical protein n=1 Tax=unclassified Acidovorax TaxID=2684926 RepID=UPI003ECF4C86
MPAKIYDAEMQYLLIEQARNVGLDPKKRVTPYDSIAAEVDPGLTPLLVYSIVVPAFRCQIRMLVDAAAPISVSEFLNQAWGINRMLGMPQRLEMKPWLLESDRGFVGWAQEIDVQCGPVQHTKAIAAYSSSILDVAFAALDGRGRGESLPQPLSDANDALAAFDNRAIEVMVKGMRPGMKQADLSMFSHWLHRGQGYLHEHHTVEADWDSTALVLKISPQKQRAFAEPVWLDHEAPALEAIIAMWPSGSKVFCEEVGVTPADMKAWLALEAPIGEEEYQTLVGMLPVRDEEGPEVFFDADGGCLLVAGTVGHATTAYNALTGNGEVGFCFEAVSPTTDFQGFRVLLFLPESGDLTIMLFKKGGKAEPALSRSELVNFQGPIAVPADMATALDVLVRDRATVADPGHAGCAFWDEFDEWLTTVEMVETGAEEDCESALHVASDLIAQHWMMTSNAGSMIEAALAMGPPKEAIQEIVRIAFAEGFRSGTKWR